MLYIYIDLYIHIVLNIHITIYIYIYAIQGDAVYKQTLENFWNGTLWHDEIYVVEKHETLWCNIIIISFDKIPNSTILNNTIW